MRYRFYPVILAVMGMLPLAAHADAASDTRQMVTHHMQVIGEGNLDAMLADYASDAVVVTPMGVTKGAAALHKMFSRIIGVPGRPAIVIKQGYYSGDLGYIIWVQSEGTPKEVRGSDTFIVRHGKIEQQTVMLVNMHATP